MNATTRRVSSLALFGALLPFLTAGCHRDSQETPPPRETPPARSEVTATGRIAANPREGEIHRNGLGGSREDDARNLEETVEEVREHEGGDFGFDSGDDRAAPATREAGGEAAAAAPAEERGAPEDEEDAAKTIPRQRVRQRPEWAKVLVPGPDGHHVALELEALNARIEIEGPRARVLLDHVFRNPYPRQLEGTFLYPLPEGASVTYFSMFQGDAEAPGEGTDPAKPERPTLPALGGAPFGTPPAALFDGTRRGTAPPDEPRRGTDRWGELREARIVEARRARRVYEEIVRRSIDPALLEWAGGQNFQGRVFPIPAHGVKRVVLAFERTLPLVDGKVQLHVPLPDTKLAQLDVDLLVRDEDVAEDHLNLAVPHRLGGGVRTHHYELRDTAPEVDVTYAYRPHDAAQQILVGPRAGAPADELPYLFARLRPEIPSVERRFARRAVFLLDTSLSEEPERFEAYRELLLAILARDGGLEAFNVLRFDFGAQWLAPEGFLRNDAAARERLAAWLDGLVLEGATNLAAAAERFAGAPFLGTEPIDVFLLSDGVVSFGPSDPETLRARFQQVGAPLRFYGYRLGRGALDAPLFDGFVRDGGAIFDARSSEGIDAVALAHTKQPRTLREVSVEGPGIEVSDLVLEGTPSGLYPGQELRLAGRVRGAGPAHVRLRLDEGPDLVLPVVIPERRDSSLAARAYGELRVADLERRDVHGERARLLVAYAQRFSVSCRRASFLILESDADHVRYDVDEEEAAASDPTLLAALADWRHHAIAAIDFDLAPETFASSALHTALEVLAALRRGEELAAFQEPLERLRTMIRPDGDVRRTGETLLAQTLACEALALAAARDAAWTSSAQLVLDELLANQLVEGAFSTAPNRPPHVAVTAFASRALQAARRAGLSGTFAALVRLDRFLRRAPLTGEAATFQAGALALLTLRPGVDDGARGRALQDVLAYLETVPADGSVEETIEVLALAWDSVANAVDPARRETLERRLVTPLLDRFAWNDGAVESAPDSSYARWCRAFLPAASPAFLQTEGELTERAGRDAAALFLAADIDAPPALGVPAEASNARADSLTTAEWRAYLEARAQRPDDLELYASTARKRLERGDVAGALRTLSSIVERHPRDSRALRLVGYFLLEWNRPDLAHPVFATVLEERPFEPHSHRDLAKVEAGVGRPLAAARHYETILDGAWHARFGSMKVIVQDEYARMLHGAIARSEGLSADLRDRFGERMERLGAGAVGRADLRVTIAWNTDATDVDLWVTEPNGEKCFYSHRETTNGGRLLEDLTQGYGPERYELREARPGSYLVQAHYYSQNPNTLGGLTFVTATITKHAGTAREETMETTVLLRLRNEVATLATPSF